MSRMKRKTKGGKAEKYVSDGLKSNERSGRKPDGRFRKFKEEKAKKEKREEEQPEKPTLEKHQCTHCRNMRHWISSGPKFIES